MDFIITVAKWIGLVVLGFFALELVLGWILGPIWISTFRRDKTNESDTDADAIGIDFEEVEK